MSESAITHDSGAEVRPFTIRITDQIRQQLEVLAEINGRSATEESRIALQDWFTRAKSDPELKKRAESVQSRLQSATEMERKRIEREAEAKRKAIESVLGTKVPSAKSDSPGKKPTSSESKNPAESVPNPTAPKQGNSAQESAPASKTTKSPAGATA